MKLLFFSDIHGVPDTLARLLEHVEVLKPDRLVLLGDVLYHGPRNGVPEHYNSPLVAGMLNARRRDILAVRGNCDSEVDQQLLEFPMMSDFSELLVGGRHFFLTHGHRWNKSNLPPISEGTVLVHGHTHIPELTLLPEKVTIFNPGSITLPKGGFPRTFGFFDGEGLSVRRLEDGIAVFRE